MKNVDILAIKSVSLNEMFEAAPEPAKDLLCSFESDGETLKAQNNSLTLVLDRDIHHAIDHSAGMAIYLSTKFPERNILLINTYASAELMQQSLMRGMAGAKVLLPASWKYRAAFSNVAAKADVQFSDSPETKLPPNLRVLNCPYATLTTALIDSEITAHKCDIVLLNSFEFASLSHYAKALLAQGLVSLRVNRKLSMVVYSQDRHKGLSTFALGRGPIGMIAPFSGAIWRFYGG